MAFKETVPEKRETKVTELDLSFTGLLWMRAVSKMSTWITRLFQFSVLALSASGLSIFYFNYISFKEIFITILAGEILVYLASVFILIMINVWREKG